MAAKRNKAAQKGRKKGAAGAPDSAAARARARRRPGRPGTCTPEITRALCAALMEGDSLRVICKRPGMPGERTVFEWLADGWRKDGKEEHRAFAEAYGRARDVQQERRLEEIEALTRSPPLREDSHVKVQRDKLRADNLKWIAARLAPKRYADRLELDHKGTAPTPAVVNIVVKQPKDAQVEEGEN